MLTNAGGAAHPDFPRSVRFDHRVGCLAWLLPTSSTSPVARCQQVRLENITRFDIPSLLHNSCPRWHPEPLEGDTLLFSLIRRHRRLLLVTYCNKREIQPDICFLWSRRRRAGRERTCLRLLICFGCTGRCFLHVPITNRRPNGTCRSNTAFLEISVMWTKARESFGWVRRTLTGLAEELRITLECCCRDTFWVMEMSRFQKRFPGQIVV